MGDANGSGHGRPSGGAHPPAGPPPGPLSGGAHPARPPRRRALLLLVAGVLVLAVGVIGLLVGTGAVGGGSGGGGPTAEPSREATQAARSRTPTTSAATPTGPPPAASGDVHAFGEPERYTDGVEVEVAEPRRFTPSEGAAGHRAGHVGMVVEVALRNGTDRRIDLSTVVVRCLDAEGRQAGLVFDAESNVLGLTGSLLPGRSARASYGCDVPEAAASSLEVEVALGFDRDSAFWSGRVP